MKKQQLMREAKALALQERIANAQANAEEKGLAYKEEEIPPGMCVYYLFEEFLSLD